MEINEYTDRKIDKYRERGKQRDSQSVCERQREIQTLRYRSNRERQRQR